MSDTRFTILGIIAIFAGFMVLSIFGSHYFSSTIQDQEFDDCFEYFEDMPPVPIDCDLKNQDKTLFFVLVISLIGAGVILLIKGIRGKWDQDIKPEDMVGPGDPKKD